jgi:hypothetical protein
MMFEDNSKAASIAVTTERVFHYFLSLESLEALGAGVGSRADIAARLTAITLDTFSRTH